MDDSRNRKAQGVEVLIPVGKISRRAMIAGTVATTAVAAVLPLSNSAYAQTQNPRLHEDMVAFLLLSEALTGVSRHTLAPEFPPKEKEPPEILDADPGVDPINIKDDYLNFVQQWAEKHDKTGSLPKLLKIAKDNRKSKGTIVPAVNASDDPTKYLARSIVLMWYLGSWYDPGVLQNVPHSPDLLTEPIPSRVVGAKAYTQGLVWLIAGTHPMGYSNLQFGYWSRSPQDPNGQNGEPLPLFNPAES